ncbi:MAG: hypothetical protein ACRD40_08690 [Candidatus Acidiferrales bacterium]
MSRLLEARRMLSGKPKPDSVGPPTDLDFEKALMFFHAYMYGPLQGKLRLYGARGVRAPSAAMTSDWEVFASILVRDVGKKLGAGVDLSGHEVKSAYKGGNYEYQYHKKTGKEKLKNDAEVGHLFFDHRNNLRRVDLRYAHGSLMKGFFQKWLKEYPDPYPQRYRKNIPFTWVKNHAVLLMTLEDGEVTFPKTITVAGTEGAG